MTTGSMNLAVPLSLLLAASVTAQESARTREAPGPERIRATSAELDRLLDEELRARGIRPSERIDDAEFCRRAWLVIAGRIPTAEELASFVADRSKGKRDALVDRLLASPAHVSHSFNRWADLLRIQSRGMRGTSGEPYAHWLKQALADDRPYDEFVRELLTAQGPAHARGNGATGWYLRDLGMPLDNLSNAMRTFLGTRMECAQCHDHPFDTWTQKQFYELAAFTGGMRYAAEGTGMDPRRLQTQTRELRLKYGEDAQRVLQQLRRQVATGIAGSGTGALALPKDYKYDDARPGQVVRAKVPFGEQPELREPERVNERRPLRPARGDRAGGAAGLSEIDSRAAFATWVTSPENPRFTKVIVNRLWKEAFGRALHEPVDDFREEQALEHTELFAFLERTMREFRYDLRAFEAVLFRSALFSRRAVVVEAESEASFAFAGPALRRLTAEQLWDSVLTLGIGDPDGTLAAPGAKAEPVYREYDSLLSKARDDLDALVQRERLRTTDPAEYRRLRAQDMAAMTTDAPMGVGENRRGGDDLRAKGQELARELKAARDARDRAKVDALTKEIAALRDRATRDAQARNRDLARASELAQPVRPGHFLREFGQSDREQIDASSSEANVPQALRLMNGVVDDQLLAKGSLLVRTLENAADSNDRVRAAYRAVLSRDPRRDELALWRKDLDVDPAAGARDLVWTLVNCQEFRFVP